jgi:hypothetical protein
MISTIFGSPIDFPGSSDNFTTGIPLIDVSFITMFMGELLTKKSDAFEKSDVKKVPIPNEHFILSLQYSFISIADNTFKLLL